MKKILYIIPLIICFSCVDTLEEDPKDFISEENFYNSEADAEAAVIAVYESNLALYDPWMYSLLTIHSDYCNGTGSQQNIGDYSVLLNGTNISRVALVYENLYQGINRANVVIQKVPEIEFNESTKSELLAEAHFLRAYYYFYLVRLFGPVPLRLEEFRSDDQVGAPRESIDKVYQVILDDLAIAETDLPDGYPDSETGRATLWAAKAILADVHLTLGNFQEVLDLTEGVINESGLSLAKVNEPDDFQEIFGANVNQHSEYIFSVHYAQARGTQIPAFTHAVQKGYSAAGYRAYHAEPLSFIGSWDGADLRKGHNLYDSYIDPNGVSQELPLLFGKFRDGNASAADAHSMKLPIYRYADILLMWAEASNQLSGPTSQSFERFNMVHRRAYGYDPDMASPVDIGGLNKQEFQDLILLERGKEFIMEPKRWFDLLRTNTAKAVIEDMGKSFNDARLLFPIPITEIQNNPAISYSDQNPGY